jgi:zinc and cadmium transporter
MLVIGDTLHNAIDGVAIAFAYLVAPSVGVVTTIAVAFHELPQEIGDFGLLLKSGWRRRKIVYANVLSALATVVAATIVFYFGRNHEGLVAPALALSAGMLLYIALSDVLPSVHENHPQRKWFDSANMLLISGAAVVYFAILISHHIEG